jgi:hypothetical protein
VEENDRSPADSGFGNAKSPERSCDCSHACWIVGIAALCKSPPS